MSTASLPPPLPAPRPVSYCDGAKAQPVRVDCGAVRLFDAQLWGSGDHGEGSFGGMCAADAHHAAAVELHAIFHDHGAQPDIRGVSMAHFGGQ
eukprot:SAG11_NODE_3085_length_2705_cov_2.939754_3_plen_93_part_00